jgi:hypothetical protein
MKKLLIICLIISAIGCAKEKPKDPISIINDEREINFPFIDLKKAEKHIDVLELSFASLPLNKTSSFYILPVKYENLGNISFNEHYSKMIENYIIINALGKIVHKKELSDYYIIPSVKESIASYLSENYSLITLDIFTTQDIPIFHVKIKVASKRDDNFYYHPSTAARPPDYLTQTGFIYILNKYFNKIFEGGK